jgi:flagellar protein FliL
MSETEKAAPGADDNAAPKKKGMKKIILLVLIVLIVGGGAASGFFYWRSRAATETAKKTDKKTQSKKDAAEGETDEAESTSKKSTDPLKNALPEDEDVKKIVELPPFIVNLADSEQARYLRMTVSLGVDGEGGTEKPDQLFITRVRNAMLAVLSDKRSDDILTPDGKAKLRKELLTAAKAASEEPEVKAIYITDFIVQL